MYKILLLSLIMAAGAKYKMGDRLHFKFKKTDGTIASRCGDIGEVSEILHFKEYEYMIRLSCGNTVDYIWVKEKDVIKKL